MRRLAFLFYLICSFVSFGQEVSKPMSPTAASLATYGESPVSYYSGSTSVSIDLGGLKGKELAIPVSLSYNTSGIRVTDNASWVGLGWSLNAGGVITQVVKGERESAAPDIRRQNASTPLMTGTAELVFNRLQNIYNRTVDFEADVFHYNFMGKAGTFVFDDQGKPHFSNHENFKIHFVGETTTTNANFVVTTEDGVKYEFNAVEVTGVPNLVDSDPSAYYLTKITSATGAEVIEFEYENEYFSYWRPIQMRRTISTLANSGSVAQNDYGQVSYQAITWGKRLKKIRFNNLGEIHFSPSSQPRTDLYSSDASRATYALDQVQLKTLTGTIIKSYKLEYENVETSDPYSDSNRPSNCGTCLPAGQVANHLNNRMYLKKVYEQDVSQLNSQNTLLNANVHEFSYYGRLSNGKDRLPNKMSGNQDYWGFFNGRSNGFDLCPGYCGVLGRTDPIYGLPQEGYCSNIPYRNYQYWETPGADRRPTDDTDILNAGTLKTIKYPTGGESVYIYESNEFSPNVMELPLRECGPSAPYISKGGGLRIKEIKVFDGIKQVKGTEYSYGLGFLRDRPVFHQYAAVESGSGERGYVIFPGNPCLGNNPSVNISLEINSGSLNDVGYRGGPLIGYEEVTEKAYSVNATGEKEYNGSTTYEYLTQRTNPDYPETPDATFNLISRIEGRYYVFGRSIDNYLTHPFVPLENLDWSNGLLTKVTVKNKDGNLKKQVDYVYENKPLSTVYSAKTSILKYDWGYYFMNYKFRSGKSKLVKTVETLY